jgi:hypothetical protein
VWQSQKGRNISKGHLRHFAAPSPVNPAPPLRAMPGISGTLAHPTITTKVFDKLVASKLAKGYQYSSASAGQIEAYRQPGDEGTDTGICCQLLNPIEEGEQHRQLTDNRHCLQEKHDGRRLMIRNQLTLICEDGESQSATIEVPVAIQGIPPVIGFEPNLLASVLEIGPTMRFIDGFSPLLASGPGGVYCVLIPKRCNPAVITAQANSQAAQQVGPVANPAAVAA